MSDVPADQPLSSDPAGAAENTAATAPYEQIPRGLIFASGAVIAGIAATILVWRLGFIASITSFLMAAGAIYLYQRGAGAPPRKGLVPLLLIILLGVVASFFAVVASDAWTVYDDVVVPGSESRWTFITDNIFRGDVLGAYAKDMAMFGVFAVLGVYGTVRRLLSQQG